ncbi:MAG: DMT family transporter [Rhodospirillales bacterium]|nr:DMT family transporter [Rhodospirillales bacterium]
MSSLVRITNNLMFVRISVILAAGFWGLFWIPIRALDEQGISAAWATVLFHALPFILMLPVAVWRWKKLVQGGWILIVLGFFLGLAIALYATAYLFSDVVRVLLLYYLLPVWATLLGRVMLNEPITRPRMVAIALGLSGMLAILGIGDGIPWPRNLGDWMALAGGMLWAFGSVLTKDDETNGPVEITFCFFGFATAASLALLLVPQLAGLTVPSMENIIAVMPWMIPVAIFLILPVIFVVIWGTGILDPGHIGILFLSEISVGAIAAAIITDEPFGLREMMGVLLITGAGLCEAVEHSFAARRKKSQDAFD